MQTRLHQLGEYQTPPTSRSVQCSQSQSQARSQSECQQQPLPHGACQNGLYHTCQCVAPPRIQRIQERVECNSTSSAKTGNHGEPPSTSLVRASKQGATPPSHQRGMLTCGGARRQRGSRSGYFFNGRPPPKYGWAHYRAGLMRHAIAAGVCVSASSSVSSSASLWASLWVSWSVSSSASLWASLWASWSAFSYVSWSVSWSASLSASAQLAL